MLDFGYETEEDVHKMFELWVLFEMAWYFHGRGFKINPITVYQMKKMFPGITIEELYTENGFAPRDGSTRFAMDTSGNIINHLQILNFGRGETKVVLFNPFCFHFSDMTSNICQANITIMSGLFFNNKLLLLISKLVPGI